MPAQDSLPELVPIKKPAKERLLTDAEDTADDTSSGSSSTKTAAVKKGFLNDTKTSLYGEEGSAQGTVSDKQKTAWQVQQTVVMPYGIVATVTVV